MAKKAKKVKKAAPKKRDAARTERLNFRLTPAEKKALLVKAKAKNLNLTAYVVQLLNVAA